MNRLHSLIVMGALTLMTACGGGGGGSSNSSGSGGGTTVTGTPMLITTTTLPDGIAGKTYSAQLSATGGITPYTWGLVTALPPGLMLNQATGLISGTLQSWGGDVTVVVQDSGSPRQSVTQKLSMNLYAELSIYTASVPAGHTNIPYDFVLQSIDVKTWSITAGQLPPGLQLAAPSRTQVELKGTATQKGSYTFTVRAESVSNPPQVASKTYTLDVDDEPAVLNTQLLDVIRNQSYQDVLTAVNGTAPYHWSVQTGTLPDGMMLDANTGVISGTMTTYGVSSLYNLTFQVTGFEHTIAIWKQSYTYLCN
jgi:hypothetical protein